jgi:hypothetical protein
MVASKETTALDKVLEEEGGVLAAVEYPADFDVVAAALGDPQPAEIEAAAAAAAEADEGWLHELARAGSDAVAFVDARERRRAFLEAPEGDSDDSGCWSSDEGASDEGGPDDDAELFDPTARVQHGIDHGRQLPLEHMGRWHACQEMQVVLQDLIQLSAKGPRPLSPEAARALSPEAAPLSPRVINRLNPKETRKGIFYPRPAQSWGGAGQAWRPNAPWERNTQHLDRSLVPPRDVKELGQRLVSAAQDWADIQRRERKGRGQLSAVTDVLSSVRKCLETIHGGSLGVAELKPYFERMLRHVQHLYVASIPPEHRMHGGEFPPDLPYRDVADRKYHAKPPVPSHFVDSAWAKRAPACKPAPRRQTKADKARAARRAKKAADEADALGQTDLMLMLDSAQKQKPEAPAEGAGYAARAVSKVLGKPPGAWSWEEDHPDALAVARHDASSKAAAAASAPVGRNKRQPSKFKVRAQLQEELTAATQGVAGLEEKAARLRAQLEAVRLAEQAEAAERDTVTLAATLAGVMDSTELLLGVAKANGVRPPRMAKPEPEPEREQEPEQQQGHEQEQGQEQEPEQERSEEQMDPSRRAQREAAAARRAQRDALKFAAGGYSYEQVVEVGAQNLRRWQVDPAREEEQRAATWRYQGAEARISKAKEGALALAEPTRPVDLEPPPPATAQELAARNRQGQGSRRKQSGFKVEEKHLPTAGKFLFDGPGRVPRSTKYKAVIQTNVQAAAEARREAMKERGIGR